MTASGRTQVLCRIFGPYLTIAAAAALARASQMRDLVSEFGSSIVWCWVTGAFVLLVGLTVLALHQIWRGVPAITVSTLGWVIAAKGVFLLAFPDRAVAAADFMIDHGGGGWQASMMIMLLVGIYLTSVGWLPTRKI